MLAVSPTLPPPLTTIIYTHPADEEMATGVRDLPC
jgi:hypothetical protein